MGKQIWEFRITEWDLVQEMIPCDPPNVVICPNQPGPDCLFYFCRTLYHIIVILVAERHVRLAQAWISGVCLRDVTRFSEFPNL